MNKLKAITIGLFFFCVFFSQAQEGNIGIREYRYSVKITAPETDIVEKLKNDISVLPGVTTCKFDSFSQNLFIETSEKENQTAATSDFKLLFEKYSINVLKYEKEVISVNENPVPDKQPAQKNPDQSTPVKTKKTIKL